MPNQTTTNLSKTNKTPKTTNQTTTTMIYDVCEISVNRSGFNLFSGMKIDIPALIMLTTVSVTLGLEQRNLLCRELHSLPGLTLYTEVPGEGCSETSQSFLPGFPTHLISCPSVQRHQLKVMEFRKLWSHPQDVLLLLCVLEGSGFERPQRWHLTNTLQVLVLELWSPSGVALPMCGLFLSHQPLLRNEVFLHKSFCVLMGRSPFIMQIQELPWNRLSNRRCHALGWWGRNSFGSLNAHIAHNIESVGM